MDEKLASADDWFELEFERLIDQFEQAWQRNEPPDIGLFLERGQQVGLPPGPLLEELVRVDLCYRWGPSNQPLGDGSAFERFQLEDYQRRFPDLKLSCGLIVDEFKLRSRDTVPPSPTEYARRFPQYADQLSEALQLDKSTEKTSATRTAGQPAPTKRARSGSTAARAPVKPPQRVGRYEIRAELGRGSFGVVYLANDPALQRQVAVKTPHARIARDPARLAECLREARLVAALRHPGLVQVFDVVRERSQDYIVMEFIGRCSLRDRLNDGPLDPSLATQILASVAVAVHEAHRVGVTHRDLKPANILLDEFDHPHVADFGLAVRNETRLE